MFYATHMIHRQEISINLYELFYIINKNYDTSQKVEIIIRNSDASYKSLTRNYNASCFKTFYQLVLYYCCA